MVRLQLLAGVRTDTRCRVTIHKMSFNLMESLLSAMSPSCASSSTSHPSYGVFFFTSLSSAIFITFSNTGLWRREV